MSAQHTPTPWNVAAIQKGNQIVDNAQNGQWQFIAETRTSGDAAFIVRAVNSHEELLGAAKNLVKELGKGDPEYAMSIPEKYAFDILKEVIAQAEARP